MKVDFILFCSVMVVSPKFMMGNILIVKIVTFIRMRDDIRSYDVVTLIIKIRRRLKVHYFTIAGGVIHQIVSYL